MKILKKTAALMLCLFLLLGACGCSSIFSSKAVEEAEAIPKIAFGTMPISENSDEVIMSVEEFGSIEIEYDRFRSDYHFTRLSEQEKLLYNAFEYALEKSCTYIYVDARLIPSVESFAKALKFLSLDSPLLEQNLVYEAGNFTTYYEVGRNAYAKLEGTYFYVKNFTSQIWNKKLETVKKAEEIIGKMASGLSDTEKAKYLHRYTVENVQYFDYAGEDGIGNYLYDGLIAGKTHCDGSSNMLSLLLNIAGIDCYEKMYTGERIVGHTWNMAELDGKWHNLDATARNKNQTDNIEYYLKRNFAFEDRLQRFIPDYSEIYPAVTESLENGVNTHFEKLDVTSFIAAVKSAFAQNGDNYAVLLVDNYDEIIAETAMQRLADSLKTKVSWYCYEVIENRTVIVVYI